MPVRRLRSLVLSRFSLACALGAVVLAAPAWGRADYCEGRVQAAMEEMLDQRARPVGSAERDSMQQALMGLCRDALQAGGGQTPDATDRDLPQDEAVAEKSVAKDAENSTLFGIEFKKADKDSAGNERLKRKL